MCSTVMDTNVVVGADGEELDQRLTTRALRFVHAAEHRMLMNFQAGVRRLRLTTRQSPRVNK